MTPIIHVLGGVLLFLGSVYYQASTLGVQRRYYRRLWQVISVSLFVSAALLIGR